MSQQSPSSEPREQPHVAPKGPEFGGPGYEPLDQPSPLVPPPPASIQSTGGQAVAPPPVTPAPTPHPAPTPIGSPAPYQPYGPPPAAPAPVYPPHHQPDYGYGVPGYQPQPYLPQPYPYYPPVEQEHPSSVPVLVLGVVGLFVPFLSPVAWYMGSKAKREVRRGAPYRWAVMGQVGYVLGVVYTLLMALFAVAFIMFAAASF